jgi:lantibiotic modifying enzyme
VEPRNLSVTSIDSSRNQWKPVLAAEEAQHLRSLLVEYSRACVKAIVTGDSGFDLANGAIGASLLRREMETSGLGDGMPAVSEILRIAERRMHTVRITGGLWQGAIGYLWAQVHLGEDALRWRDQKELVAWVGQQDSFDLVGGVVGAGVLGLELREAGDAIVGAVLRRLVDLGETNEYGLAWPSRGVEPGKRTFDLGIAHGHAGVVAFLAGASHRFEVARSLLVQAVASLAAQARPAPSPWAFSHFGGPASASRLAWCYGDPGVAIAIARAARALASDEMAALAREVAVRAARRLGDRSVMDVGLCHGSSGLAHVFARLWQYTGEKVCADAARFWILQTLQQRSREGQNTPFPSAQDQDGIQSIRDDAGLITGGTGVCLALLSAISAHEPAWDRSMLLSA